MQNKIEAYIRDILDNPTEGLYPLAVKAFGDNDDMNPVGEMEIPLLQELPETKRGLASQIILCKTGYAVIPHKYETTEDVMVVPVGTAKLAPEQANMGGEQNGN